MRSKATPRSPSARVPLVLDMYDPTPLENLALWRTHTPANAPRRAARDARAAGAPELRAGDCFLCATERQRDMYLGALLAIGGVLLTGRCRPDAAGPAAGRAVWSTGRAARAHAAALAAWPGEQVILWSGGLWD